jgi:predicted dehydrogenase
MLKVAIVGCGAVVDELHVLPLRRITRHGVLQVTALIDRAPARAETLRRYFRDARVFGSIEEAGLAGALDLTLITSPPGLHAEHALAAFSLGSHVLCEKPLTILSSEAERMVAAAARAQRLLAVGMTRRFYPNFAEIAGLLARGELGDGVQFVCREGGLYGWPIATDAAFRREVSGGGVLMDKGVHVLDSLCWLFGEPHVVRCRDDAQQGGVEANSIVELEFPNARGMMQLSWDQPLANGLHIKGPEGEIRVEPNEIIEYQRRPPGGTWRRVRSEAKWPAEVMGPKLGQPKSYYDCFDFQLTSVIRALLHGEPLTVDGSRAAQVLRALDHAYAVARPLPCPWLGEREQAAQAAGHWRQSV